MKIGILTHHYINNFGAFLQAYALQNAIQKQFPNDEVQIIDLINIKHYVINIGGWFRFYKEKENFKCWKQKIQMPGIFKKARKENLNLSKRCYNAKDINKLKYDYIVVGSDEVWNYKEKKGNSEIKFGVGLEGSKLIAYAPSVGKSEGFEIPEYAKDGIKSFRAVSARDIMTEKFAGKIRNEKITRVVDPTFLTTIPNESVDYIKKPFLLFYYCDGLHVEQKKELVKFAISKGMDIYGAGECDKLYSTITVRLTPFQWVWMFKNASYIVTGTFHGAVFSMLNHRQFACYVTNPSRKLKVSSLLDEFNLNDRLTDGNSNSIISVLEKNIEYSEKECKFNLCRDASKNFIMKAVE